jgi:twitching motility protein PilT
MGKTEGRPSMDHLLRLALGHEASDLHLKAGQPPVLRIGGNIRYTDLAALSADDVLDLAGEIMDDRVRREFETVGAADFSHRIETGDRFRVNVYRERGFASVAARRVSRRVPTFKELHLDEKLLTRLCEAPQGLIVFAGITGCGKSTSIASALDHINHTRRCHIVTIEDPIEFLFEDHTAFVNQREIGTDCPTFDLALKHLMRQDPDVVLVGEMRDRDTCESVLRAAETGHLVFTTLHSSSAPGAITRLLDLFHPEEHPIIRQTLAANLVAVVCQNLVPSADPNVARVPATEVLLSSAMVRKMIREGDEDGLGNVLAADTAFGMHDFTWDLARLVREEWVDPKVAYEVAPNAEALKMAIRGIAVKPGTIR